jgi:hypothetical protein
MIQYSGVVLLRHHDRDWPDQVIAPPTSSGIFVQEFRIAAKARKA